MNKYLLQILILVFCLISNYPIYSQSNEIEINVVRNGKLYYDVHNIVFIYEGQIVLDEISRSDFEIEEINQRCIYVIPKNRKVSRFLLKYKLGSKTFKKYISILETSKIPEPYITVCNVAFAPEGNSCPQRYPIGALLIEPPFLTNRNKTILKYEVLSFSVKLIRKDVCIDSILHSGFYNPISSYSSYFFKNVRPGDILQYQNLIIKDAFDKLYFPKPFGTKIIK